MERGYGYTSEANQLAGSDGLEREPSEGKRGVARRFRSLMMVMGAKAIEFAFCRAKGNW